MSRNYNPKKVAEIIKLWATGESSIATKTYTVDKRRVSKADIFEAYICRVTDESGNLVNYPVMFQHQWEADILWELLKDACAENSGYSITNNKVWRNLGMWERSSNYFQESMLVEMINILSTLSMAGYIYFQHGGSIWDISIIKQA